MGDQASKISEPQANSKELYDLYLFMEGMRQGKGDIRPLGQVHLENLFRAFQYLREQGL